MSLNKKYILNILLVISITIIAMYFALRDHFKEIVHALTAMNPLWLLVILGWGLLIGAVTGAAYTLLGRYYKKNYSLKEGIIVSFVGTFFAGITPSSTGGQFGQIYVLKKQGLSYSDGASLLWADFIIYQTTMMIYVTILFVLRFTYYVNLNAWLWIVLAGYIVNVAVIVALYTIALFPKVYIWLSGKLPVWLSKLHLVKDPEAQVKKWMGTVTNFTGQIQSLADNKELILKTAAVNAVRLTLYFSLPFVVAVALGIPMHASQLLDTIALASFVIMANSFVPLPGASGGTEVFFTMLFQSMLGKLTGAVLLLWRISTYYLPLIVGAVLFLLFKGHHDRLKQKQILAQVKKKQNPDPADPQTDEQPPASKNEQAKTAAASPQ